MKSSQQPIPLTIEDHGGREPPRTLDFDGEFVSSIAAWLRFTLKPACSVRRSAYLLNAKIAGGVIVFRKDEFDTQLAECDLLGSFETQGCTIGRDCIIADAPPGGLERAGQESLISGVAEMNPSRLLHHGGRETNSPVSVNDTCRGVVPASVAS